MVCFGASIFSVVFFSPLPPIRTHPPPFCSPIYLSGIQPGVIWIPQGHLSRDSSGCDNLRVRVLLASGG